MGIPHTQGRRRKKNHLKILPYLAAVLFAM
jgi:hypothetical protein